MTSGWNARTKVWGRKAVTGLLLAGAASALVPAPALAQDEARLRRIEAELRALQRAVFPTGDNGRFFTPEVVTPTPGAQPQTPSGATPSGGALGDVLARLEALEGQIARMTAASEENQNAVAQLQRRFEAAEATLAAARSAEPGTGLGSPPPLPSGLGTPGALPAPAPRPTPAPATTLAPPAARPGATPAPAAAPSAARLAAVRAIAKPATDDAGDDEYSYGYRLWEAGYFAEARQQLALFLQRYPSHQRVSFGRNLLGRAYLDDGQPREAAKYFFENYQNNKQGARAADSLLYLAETMIAIGDNSRACIALAEFGDTYPALATGRLKEQYDRTRTKVSCT